MAAFRVYCLGGLLLLAAAVVFIDRPESEDAALAGLLALALGLLQIYVALLPGAKVGAAVAYLAGVGALLFGGKMGVLAGRVLILLVLLVQGIGVVRFPGKAKTG